jgi:hypothetical protein
MKKFAFLLLLTLLFVTPFIPAEAKPTDYDTENEGTEDPEASEADDSSAVPRGLHPGNGGDSTRGAVKGFAGGVKQVAYDGPKEFVKETAEESTKKPPIVSVVEGVNKGTQKLLDTTVKGAYKVATLGQGELASYEVQEPEKGSGEPTKIKISIPGT